MMSEFKMYVYPQERIFTSVTPGEIQPFTLFTEPCWVDEEEHE